MDADASMFGENFAAAWRSRSAAYSKMEHRRACAHMCQGVIKGREREIEGVGYGLDGGEFRISHERLDEEHGKPTSMSQRLR